MRKDFKELGEIIEETIGKSYNIIVENDIKNYGKFHPSNIENSRKTFYDNVELIEFNGFGIGQAHFITTNGSYLILPWCAIVCMTPVEEGEVI